MGKCKCLGGDDCKNPTRHAPYEITLGGRGMIGKGCQTGQGKAPSFKCGACLGTKQGRPCEFSARDDASSCLTSTKELGSGTAQDYTEHVNMYKCDECGDRGHRKFEPEQLRQHKNSQRQKKIMCTDCIARHKQIEKVLRLPKAWKCKCPGKGHERHHRPDNVKCDLVPVRMGERRWPGKNMEVHPG